MSEAGPRLKVRATADQTHSHHPKNSPVLHPRPNVTPLPVHSAYSVRVARGVGRLARDGESITPIKWSVRRRGRGRRNNKSATDNRARTHTAAMWRGRFVSDHLCTFKSPHREFSRPLQRFRPAPSDDNITRTRRREAGRPDPLTARMDFHPGGFFRGFSMY